MLPFYCVLNEQCDADIKIANNERYSHTHTRAKLPKNVYMYVCTSKKYYTPKKLITNSTLIKHVFIPVSKNKRNFIRIEFP